MEKFKVEDEIDVPDWVAVEAEGHENARPFMLGWNKAIDEMDVSEYVDERIAELREERRNAIENGDDRKLTLLAVRIVELNRLKQVNDL